MNIVLIIVVLVLDGLFLNRRGGNPTFWRAASQHPERAMQWFCAEACWTIVRPGEPPPSSSNYTPGFSVFDPQTGGMVKGYCVSDQIEASQARFLRSLQNY